MAPPAHAREMGIKPAPKQGDAGGLHHSELALCPTALLHSFTALHLETVGKNCPHLQRVAGGSGS